MGTVKSSKGRKQMQQIKQASALVQTIWKVPCRYIYKSIAYVLSICMWLLKGIFSFPLSCWYNFTGLFTQETTSENKIIRGLRARLNKNVEQEMTSENKIIRGLRARQKDLESRIEKLEISNEEIEARLSDKTVELEALTKDKNYLESKLQQSEHELETLRKEKGEALNRLSELMGAKLCDNNPAITNLNDPNRQMKLGEQFSELYENDWTDAYQEMTDPKHMQLTDEDAISALLSILKEINGTCLNYFAEQIEEHKALVNGLSEDVIESYMKSVKELIKTHAAKFIPLVCKRISSNESTYAFVSKYKKYCQQYIEKCIRICYFAALQNPPMFLDFEPGQFYDRCAYKEYTKSGKKVDFLVWPALHLHNGGPVLCKGVVQPIE